MTRPAPVAVITCWTIAGVMAACAAVSAHSGPPFPLVSNVATGAYVISLWADPDATDDGSAAGRFWVMIDSAHRGAVLPPDTGVTVSTWPLDRQGPVKTGGADPVAREVSRRFVALVMDHEGRYAVRVTIQGPLGPGEVDTECDATYDQRPAPIMLVVSLTPFLLVGFLWLKLLLRRRSGK